jgi:transcriptional regulator with XRE-family HTH domain
MHAMGRANELVDDIRRERGWSTEALAEACGYSRTQTNYYCNGQATVPVEFLAQLFEHTLDPRIPLLSTGRRPVVLDVEPPLDLADASDAASLNAVIAQRREQIEAEQAVLDLLEHGIDPAEPGERARLQKANREIDEAVIALRSLKRRMNAIYLAREQENARRAQCNGRPTGKVKT